MEIAITGEGAVVIRFIDKSGRTLLEERITVSGSATIEARRIVDLSLNTTGGRALLAPVLMQQSNPEQHVTFDREIPSRFTRLRCKKIGCNARITQNAVRGKAPPPVQGQGPAGVSDDRRLDRVVRSIVRDGSRR
jgi:hypothetical protein